MTLNSAKQKRRSTWNKFKSVIQLEYEFNRHMVLQNSWNSPIPNIHTIKFNETQRATCCSLCTFTKLKAKQLPSKYCLQCNVQNKSQLRAINYVTELNTFRTRNQSISVDYFSFAYTHTALYSITFFLKF